METLRYVRFLAKVDELLAFDGEEVIIDFLPKISDLLEEFFFVTFFALTDDRVLLAVLLVGVELRAERYEVCLGSGALDLFFFSVAAELLTALSRVGAFFAAFTYGI